MLDQFVRPTTANRPTAFRCRGLTLVELMVTLVVVGIALSVGVPTFRGTIERNQLVSKANSFLSTLTIARSEAVKRGKVMTVCKSSDGTSCNDAAAGYEVGWIAFVDEDGDGVRDAEDELVKREYPFDPGYTLRGTAVNGIDDSISYRPSGRSSATGEGSVVLCKDGDSTKSRTIVIEFTGRTSVKKDDGVACG